MFECCCLLITHAHVFLSPCFSHSLGWLVKCSAHSIPEPLPTLRPTTGGYTTQESAAQLTFHLQDAANMAFAQEASNYAHDLMTGRKNVTMDREAMETSAFEAAARSLVTNFGPDLGHDAFIDDGRARLGNPTHVANIGGNKFDAQTLGSLARHRAVNNRVEHSG